jgi:hypothetical protein
MNPSIIYYINYKNKPEDCNVRFKIVGEGKGIRVIVITTQGIPKGDEAFAQYGYTSFFIILLDIYILLTAC